MAATETPTRNRLSPDAAKALAIRHQAAMSIIRETVTPEERWDLLAAVVWPSHPLLGLASSTSSVTE